MSRSLRVDPKYIQKVNLALKRNGYPSQQKFAEDIVPSLSTVKNFLKGKPVDYENFREICDRLGLDWQAITYVDVDVEPDEEVAKPHRESVESDAGSIEERYFRATSNFDSLEPLERKSRIQVLEEIARDSPRYHWKVMEFLADFVRRKAPRKEEEEWKEERSVKIPEDIQAALTAIGQRDLEKDPPKKSLDLSNTDIRGAVLSEGKLQGINFSGANLQGANLSRANLQEADLTKANLKEADIRGANLQEANVFQAVLRRANLWGANLEKAFLMETDLSWAAFWGNNMRGADLHKANLQGAELMGVTLCESDLRGADLREVELRSIEIIEIEDDKQHKIINVNLQGAVFYQANLKGVDLSATKNLESEQIKWAYGNSMTVLPENVVTPADWM
jgi:uncharacterized protein YjbI with pentapeptide repeats